MLKLAWRNLAQNRLRLLLSIGGIALAVVLILAMGGIFAGSEEHAVLYIRNQPAPIWIMQAGVANLHMSSSLLLPEVVEEVQSAPGVERAVGVLYATAGLEIKDAILYSYVFGIDPGIPFGGPWSLVAGTADLGFNEIVVDHDLASRYGLGLGDQIQILGYPLTIAGLSAETFGIATNIVFVNKTAMAFLMGTSPDAASYVLVQPAQQVDPTMLADELRRTVPDTNVMSQEAFAKSDQDMIGQMGADVIQLMNIVAYIIGLLVVAITVYTAVLDRIREYAVLKAIGASHAQLLRVVLTQSFAAASLGFVVGVLLAYLTATAVVRLFPEILILIRPSLWMPQIPVLIVVTGIATLLPMQRVMRIDPLVVFKE